MAPSFKSICRQIEKLHSGLAPQLKRAARHALDHPDDVALLSMRQLAIKADVHPSTMTRLVKALNLNGYDDFQEPFRTRLRTRPEALYSKNAKSIQSRSKNHGADGAAAMMGEMMDTEHSNLNAIAENIGHETLSQCANAMANARHVYVGGVRSCYPVAFYFQYACSMFKNNVSLIDGRGGTFADDLRGVEKGDVLLAISFTPYGRNMVHAVDYASGRGAHIIAITDSILSPILKAKNTTPLIVQTSSPSFFHSVVPAMSVVQTLVLFLMANGGENALKKLSESEAQLNTFEAYWPNR
ncbi:MAG: MurR/RpiR family transcriptional regulator [Rhodospirillaceae bacterium]|nr:MurR/RpiR family transcriptional regulator [Rhodospirillaceae bacterium]